MNVYIFNTLVLIFLVIYWGLKINYAVRMANNLKPYNPPKQMYMKEGKIHFKEMSQRTAWWKTFWRYL